MVLNARHEVFQQALDCRLFVVLIHLVGFRDQIFQLVDLGLVILVQVISDELVELDQDFRITLALRFDQRSILDFSEKLEGFFVQLVLSENLFSIGLLLLHINFDDVVFAHFRGTFQFHILKNPADFLLLRLMQVSTSNLVYQIEGMKLPRIALEGEVLFVLLWLRKNLRHYQEVALDGFGYLIGNRCLVEGRQSIEQFPNAEIYYVDVVVDGINIQLGVQIVPRLADLLVHLFYQGRNLRQSFAFQWNLIHLLIKRRSFKVYNSLIISLPTLRNLDHFARVSFPVVFLQDVLVEGLSLIFRPLVLGLYCQLVIIRLALSPIILLVIALIRPSFVVSVRLLISCLVVLLARRDLVLVLALLVLVLIVWCWALGIGVVCRKLICLLVGPPLSLLVVLVHPVLVIAPILEIINSVLGLGLIARLGGIRVEIPLRLLIISNLDILLRHARPVYLLVLSRGIFEDCLFVLSLIFITLSFIIRAAELENTLPLLLLNQSHLRLEILNLLSLSSHKGGLLLKLLIESGNAGIQLGQDLVLILGSQKKLRILCLQVLVVVGLILDLSLQIHFGFLEAFFHQMILMGDLLSLLLLLLENVTQLDELGLTSTHFLNITLLSLPFGGSIGVLVVLVDRGLIGSAE